MILICNNKCQIISEIHDRAKIIIKKNIYEFYSLYHLFKGPLVLRQDFMDCEEAFQQKLDFARYISLYSSEAS